ncbi:hypothetical protein GCM10009677_17930 [Sphaerisporangium rubeum]
MFPRGLALHGKPHLGCCVPSPPIRVTPLQLGHPPNPTPPTGTDIVKPPKSSNSNPAIHPDPHPLPTGKQQVASVFSGVEAAGRGAADSVPPYGGSPGQVVGQGSEWVVSWVRSQW